LCGVKKKQKTFKMKKHSSDSINKTSKNILKYILELLIVAFGVFLGIYIGEQNNQQKTDANTMNALNQIISEIDSNSERLESAINYHEKVSVEIDSAANSLEQKDYETLYYKNTKFQFIDLPSWKGMGTVQLSKTIYESAKIGGVFQELNISTINLISSIYESQNIYSDFSKAILDKFFSFDSNTKTADIFGILQMTTKYDVLRMEKKLQSEMKTIKSELEIIRDNKKYKK